VYFPPKAGKTFHRHVTEVKEEKETARLLEECEHGRANIKGTQRYF